MSEPEATAPAAAEPVAPMQIGAAKLPRDAVLSAFDAALAAWVNQNIRNSPIARSTEAWNYLTAQLPALRAAFVKEI
jgi:hypothetical protein